MSRATVIVNVLREQRTSDGAGGKVMNVSPVAGLQGLTATLNFYHHKSNDRVELGRGGTSGPGQNVVTKRFLKFLPPFPDVRINDWIQVVGDRSYMVLHVRQYQNTMQVDLQIVPNK